MNKEFVVIKELLVTNESEIIDLHTIKLLQVLLFSPNNLIYRQFFVGTQLNGYAYMFCE